MRTFVRLLTTGLCVLLVMTSFAACQIDPTNNNETTDWRPNDMNTSVTSDTLYVKKVENLPDDFYAKRFTDFEVRVAYDYQGAYAHAITMYYITDKDTVWNEEKSIKFQMHEVSTEGEFKVYKTSLADHTAWQNADKITGLRLDPFNCQGTFIVDYIRFTEDPNFVYVEPEKKEFGIVNGDAETPNQIEFYSANTKISIIEEPENKKNHVYYVEANQGNTYAYFRHAAEFEPGATYNIEFDIKLIGNNADDPAQG